MEEEKKEIMKWYSLKDEPPNQHDYILITNGKIVCEVYVNMTWQNGQMMTGMRFRDQGFDDYNWEDEQGGQPTMWCEMPLPPK